MAKLKADLDLHKLEIFYWVAELKSFSRAAARLSLRQPTVSAHVQELEQALGGELLYRIRGKISLTPLGELVYDRARELLALKREAVAAVEQFHGTLSGELWVGGSNIPGEYLLPQKLGAFLSRYPEVKPILRIGDSAQIVNDVLEGKVELGFIGFKTNDIRISSQTMWNDEMVLVVPKKHPWARSKSVEIGNLRSERFISRERGSGTLESLSQLLRTHKSGSKHPLNVAMELGSTEAVKQALIAGFGISIISRVAVARELAAGLLVEVPIRRLNLQRHFYEIVHQRRPLSPACQAFRKFVKSS
jgi:DNA-binding transcriptional LysR family regulator